MQRHSRTIALGLLAASALGGMAMGPAPTARAQTTEVDVQSAPAKAANAPAKAAATRAASAFFNVGGFGSRGSQRRRGPGWTQAHVKRMAHKRRNVARNRKAHR